MTRVQEPVRATVENSKVILLVEDEPAQREFWTVTLEDYGYCVLPAETGIDALDLGRLLNVVDLVIADIVMPEMSGLDFVEALHRLHGRSIPVLFVTAYPPEDVERARPLLAKPVPAHRLLELVTCLLAHR